MVVNEAHQQFKLGVDKTDSFNSPNFLDEEIDQYLSDAQEQFIAVRAYPKKGEGVEETQKRVKDLQDITANALIPVAAIARTLNNKPDGIFVPLPTDYRHSLNETIDVIYDDCNNVSTTVNLPVMALTHDQYNTMMANPFTRPSLNRAYRLPYGRINGVETFEIITPSFITARSIYYLRYLKNPAKFNKAQRIIPPALTPFGLTGTSQIEMTDESCREIIRIAVRNALGDIQAPGTQEALQRLNEIE